MSDFLLPIDFEVNLPRSPVALGQWLLKNGVTEEIVNVLKENSVDGPTFRTLTDRDLKDLLPSFLQRKKIREWAQSVSTTLMQLKKAYYNRKPVEKPRKNKEAASSQEMENASTEEGHDSKLKTEMKRKKPDIKTICSLLKASFNHRRKWICKLQGKGTVKKILEEYPGFKNWELLMIETSLITETRQYKEAWLKMLPKLGDYVEEHAQDILEEENVENFKEIGEDGQTLLVMLSLPKAWDIQEKFIHFVEDGDDFKRFIKKELNAECHLVAAESSDKVQLFIIIDNEVIVETDSYLNGLFCFFGAQHVFNLEFTQSLKLCFKFLEEYVFGIPQKKRSTQYRSGVAKLLA